MEKVWYKSKGKVGASILTISTVLAALGAYLSGTMDLAGLLQALMAVGAGLGLWGVRDAQG